MKQRVEALIEHVPSHILYDAFFTQWNIYNVRIDLADKVRSARKKQSRNALSRGLRRRIIKTLDQDRCIYCHAQLEEEYEIDHFLAIEESLREDRDIIDNLYNLFTSCVQCNRQKHDAKYTFMYEDVVKQRQEFLYSVVNDLWLTRAGRQALKRLFKVYDEVQEEINSAGLRDTEAQ